jgi:hypothetical protein
MQIGASSSPACPRKPPNPAFNCGGISLFVGATDQDQRIDRSAQPHAVNDFTKVAENCHRLPASKKNEADPGKFLR